MTTLRAIGLAVGAVVVLAAIVTLSPSAAAAGEELAIPEDSRHVVEGDSVTINVTFGVNEDHENVTVDCGDPCPTWKRHVIYDQAKTNCFETDAAVDTRDPQESEEQSRRVCQISFPSGFERTDGGTPPSQTGEPARPRTYFVFLGDAGEAAETHFDAHLSSASTCRTQDAGEPGTGEAQRSDVVLISTSGHPADDQVTVQVRDGQRVFFERSFTSQGRDISYHFRWFVPLDFRLDGDHREVEILVDAPTSGERETIAVEPGEAQALAAREPGGLFQPLSFNRTETVEYWTRYVFLSAPRDCQDVAWNRRLTPVTQEQLGNDIPNAEIRQLNDPPNPEFEKTVDTAEPTYSPANNLLLLNYTLPKDLEATDPGDNDPRYDIAYPRTQLDDGNFIGAVNTTNIDVFPYTIEPEFLVLQDEVERLETAELVVNLTYADGSPFTPNETNDPFEIAFGLEGESPEFVFEANHRRAGVWNVSEDLGFEYEPLGDYTWRVREVTDNNGDPGDENRVEHTVTDIVDVVSARPLLNLTTFVDAEPVNGTERTRRVQAQLHAEFKNGEPLTEDNVDPSLGGVVLNIDKRNEFGRVVDQDRRVMTTAGDPGSWLQSFTVGRGPGVAPVGTWDLEVVARDDRTPANENITEFPFQVRAANVTVSDAKSPPPLVNSSTVTYRFRLNYPDGSLVSERLVDESRGGDLAVQLERVSRVNDPPIVERTIEPRPVSGGQAWRVQLNTSKIVPGNHFFNVTGQDIHGNPIGPSASDLFTVLFNGEFRNSTTPVCPETNDTLDEPCEIERGETVYVVFPGSSGDKGMVGEHPSIRVHRQDPDSGRWILVRGDSWLSPERFFNLTGRNVGNNHVGRFVTERSTPTGTYRLAIVGRAEDDTGFAGFSQTFNVTRVVVNRDVISPFPDSVKKTQEISARIEHEAGDVIDQVVAEAGPVRIRNIEADTTGKGTFLRWRPPATLPTGPASVHVEGRDLFGNAFEADLGPIQLEPVQIEVTPQGPVPDVAKRGETSTFDVQMTYETGTPFTNDDGAPDVVIEDLDGNEVDSGRAIHRVDNWQIRWSPRADLPTGVYRVVLTGTDQSGNVIQDFKTESIVVQSGTVTGEAAQEPPDSILRGETVEARFTFPTEIAEGNVTVTTGSDVVGEPRFQINGSTVDVRFTSDRTTPLTDALFRFTGIDVVGNNVTAETSRFTVQTQRLNVQWVQQPPAEVTTDETAQAAFIVEYPDGTLMRPGEGTPIVGLFARDQALGPLDAEPLEENPAVWQVNWTPPDDARTDIPLHFSASARDRFQNEAPPVASQGFFVQNPVVPEYVPTPGPGPFVALGALAGLAVLLERRRQR